MFCSNCGKYNPDYVKECKYCGCGVLVEKIEHDIHTEKTGVRAFFSANKKVIFIVLGVIVAIIFLVTKMVSCISDSVKGPNFPALYHQYCSDTWAEYGEDGSYLGIDTNPYDFEDEGIYYLEAYYAIEDINQALGLPDYLFEEMGRTTGLMGRQSRTFDKVEVVWTYHPDNGLEVIYKLK